MVHNVTIRGVFWTIKTIYNELYKKLHNISILHNLRDINIITSIAAWIKNPLRRTTEHNHIYNYLRLSFLNIPHFIELKSFCE